MTNVLLLTDKLTMGGAEQYFCTLANQLQAENLTVYTAAALGELFNKLEHKQQFTPLSHKNQLANFFIVQKLVEQFNIDVIHANSLRMLMLAAVINRLRKRRLRLIYTKHNVTILERFAPFLFKKLLNKNTDQIITVSDFEKRNLLQFDMREELIETVYNGVDLERFSIEPKKVREDFRVGILARLSKEKNHTLFLQVANLFKADTAVTFHIAGDGPERKAIEKLIAKDGLQEKVQMHGNLAEPEAFIREMDVLLLTSEREVFPMVVIEAMASGTPLVSVDVGGINEAIEHGKTGLLVTGYSEKAIADQIRNLQRDADLRDQLTKQARQKVEAAFSLQHMLRATQRLYEESSQERGLTE